MISVSFIILSYNTRDLLKRCLESVEAHGKGLNYEIIVVDNASSDGSEKMIREHFANIRLLENETNVGFAKGVNQAAKVAKGEYLLFLNSDTELQDSSIKDMVAYAKEHTHVAVVGGNLKNADNSTSKSFGKFYTLKGVYEMLFYDKRIMPAYSSPTEVDWVSGGYMLIKRDVFERVKGFDEHFFMYLEDMELCYRIKNDGKRIVYFPKSTIQHIGQGSSNRSFAIVQIYKGLNYFYQKHKSYPEYLVLKLLLTVKALGALTFGVLSGNRELMRTYRKALAIAL